MSSQGFHILPAAFIWFVFFSPSSPSPPFGIIIMQVLFPLERQRKAKFGEVELTTQKERKKEACLNPVGERLAPNADENTSNLPRVGFGSPGERVPVFTLGAHVCVCVCVCVFGAHVIVKIQKEVKEMISKTLLHTHREERAAKRTRDVQSSTLAGFHCP